jgi:ribosomal protein S27E
MEQAHAVECVNCGVVVAKYKSGVRKLVTPRERANLSIAGVVVLGLAGVGAYALFDLFAPDREAAVGEFAGPPAPPSVIPTDFVETYWFEGSTGYTRAAEDQREQRIPLLALFAPAECPDCAAVRTLFTSPELRGWFAEILKVRVDPDASPENTTLAERFKVKEYPALAVVRSDGERKLVSLYDKEALVTPAELMKRCREAAGR